MNYQVKHQTIKAQNCLRTKPMECYVGDKSLRTESDCDETKRFSSFSLSRVRYKVGPTEGSSHMQTEKPCTNSEISRFSMLVFGVGVEFGETADLAPADLQNCDLCQYY